MKPTDLITVSAAATLIGVDESQVRRYLRDGILPGTRIGRDWLIRRKDAERFQRPPLGAPKKVS